MTGAGITGLVAVAYGLGFAVLPQLREGGDDAFKRSYTLIGAAIVLLCAIVLIIVPWLRDGA